MQTDRHRPTTDRDFFDAVFPPPQQNEHNEIDSLKQHEQEKQQPLNSSSCLPSSIQPPNLPRQQQHEKNQFLSQHPLALQRIALFSCRKIQDVVKISHVTTHFREFACSNNSVKVFRNLVTIHDVSNYRGYLHEMLAASSSVSLVDLRLWPPPTPPMSPTSHLLQKYARGAHVERCLNAAIQPSSCAFSYNRDIKPHPLVVAAAVPCVFPSTSTPTPRPIPWLVDLITAAGFFGFGLGALDPFASESSARFPIHRAITYNRKDVLRLILRRCCDGDCHDHSGGLASEYDESGSLFPSSSSSHPVSFANLAERTLIQNIPLFCQDSAGSSILHYAVELKQEASVAVILEHCNSIDRKFEQQMRQQQQQYRHRRHRHHHEQRQQEGPQRSFFMKNLLSTQDFQGSNVFHAAARAGKSTVLRLLLQNLPRNRTDAISSCPILAAKNQPCNLTPLATALSYYNNKLAKMLLREEVCPSDANHHHHHNSHVDPQRVNNNACEFLSDVLTMDLLEYTTDEEMKSLIVDAVREAERNRLSGRRRRNIASAMTDDDARVEANDNNNSDEGDEEEYEDVRPVGTSSSSDDDDDDNDGDNDAENGQDNDGTKKTRSRVAVDLNLDDDEGEEDGFC